MKFDEKGNRVRGNFHTEKVKPPAPTRQPIRFHCTHCGYSYTTFNEWIPKRLFYFHNVERLHVRMDSDHFWDEAKLLDVRRMQGYLEYVAREKEGEVEEILMKRAAETNDVGHSTR